MQLRSLNVAFFFLLLFMVGLAVFFVFKPFLTAVVAAAILTALFRGTYRRFLKWFHGHKASSAFMTCILVIVIIVTPIFLILSLAINEATVLYHAIGEESSLERMLEGGLEWLRNVPHAGLFFDTETLSQERIMSDIRELSQNALGLLQAAYQGITDFVFWVFVMFFTLFYFLIDGDRMLKRLMELSPLRDEHDALLVKKFVSISRATLKGTLVLGFIQGMLGAFAFLIAGIPSPAIWGVVMVLFSIIPLAGSALIWLPAGIILILLGDTWQGLFVISFGAGIISVVDNIFRPKLVGKDTQMHPLMVFFATIGGVSLFGLSGFIIGPIIVALFLALVTIYGIEFRDQLKAYNA
jgi:predicted PurR-regulated permease PerM